MQDIFTPVKNITKFDSSNKNLNNSSLIDQNLKVTNFSEVLNTKGYLMSNADIQENPVIELL